MSHKLLMESETALRLEIFKYFCSTTFIKIPSGINSLLPNSDQVLMPHLHKNILISQYVIRFRAADKECGLIFSIC